MLNIGKLAAGGEEYYLKTVASGVEDYYLGVGEAPGYWSGGAAAQFGLRGRVAATDLRRVLAGADPRTGVPLMAGGRGRPRTVPGWDATFRAPKSVSLLWALSGSEVSRQVTQAHDEAVAQALGYLERNAAFVRRDGQQVPVPGLIVAAFRHRTSRAGDPLLHTHVLVANHARAADDSRWRALDFRVLYAHARTAGFVYQAALRAGITRHLGTKWGSVTNGYADLAGLPRRLIEEFSTRRAEILELLAERGEASAKAAQVATLDSRRAKQPPPAAAALPAPGSKDYGVDPAGLREEWTARARAVGWNPEVLRALLGTSRYEPVHPDQAAVVAGELTGPDGLTAHGATFTRRDVVRGWAQRLPQGTSALRLEALADALLAEDTAAVQLHPTAVPLGPPSGVTEALGALTRALSPIDAAAACASSALVQTLTAALAAGAQPSTLITALLERELDSADDVVSVLVWRAQRLAAGLDGQRQFTTSPRTVAAIRRGDGRVVVAQPGEPRYSTPQLVALERRAAASALARTHDRVAVADSSAVEAALARRPDLAGEQAAMVRQLTGGGAGVDVVVGKAGTGKTFALDAAREAWQTSGIPVVGAALAARTARELERKTGMRSYTLERLLLDAARTGQGLTPRSVLIIDEAAMVGTRHLARVFELAERAAAKVVLVGDHHQLPEIDAGGVFRGLVARLPTIELTTNRRQRHDWERRALDLLRVGQVEQAFFAFRRAGRVTTADTAAAACERLVADWWAARVGGDPTAQGVMLAVSRADVDRLNVQARRQLRAAGSLAHESVHAAGREFAVGDAVFCTRNAAAFDVVNGTTGTVIGINQTTGTLTLRGGDGVTRSLPRVYLEGGDLTHAYALTGHRAQGMTVERAWVLGSDLLYQEWAYAAFARHREAVQLYVVSGHEPPDWVEHPAALSADTDDPVDRLLRAMSVSRAQLLAVDQGKVDSILAEGTRQQASPRLRARLTAALQADDGLDAPGTVLEADDLRVDLAVDFAAWLAAVEACPPAYLIAALGACPDRPDTRSVWRDGAAAVERYRRNWKVTDASTPLGSIPTEPAQQLAHRQAAGALRAAQHELGITGAAPADLGLAL